MFIDFNLTCYQKGTRVRINNIQSRFDGYTGRVVEGHTTLAMIELDSYRHFNNEPLVFYNSEIELEDILQAATVEANES